MYTVKFDKTRICYRWLVYNGNEIYSCCTTKQGAEHIANVMNNL